MNGIAVLMGIGNIGEKYVSTRHNVGFMITHKFVLNGAMSKEKKFKHSQVWECIFDNKTIAVCHPNTYVNNTGIAARELLDYYLIDEKEMLVVVDDFNLLLGAMRFRGNGSDGGHNGLKSIIASTSNEFPRLRFGIGALPENVSIVDFVLGKFTEEELRIVDEKTDVAAQAVECYLKEGIVAAMNKYNSK
ncbi:MAG: aminoacyl-tRNA hydrolase [Chitinispirillales bacterium]|jgi:PTH1 family peptidyl-tRNA hydrolase|nr:aminoacyl-tRNA hydrolase [Chitinispirillales bacterium]